MLVFHGLELDDFQIKAIEAIERHDTVIVAAPTGAGKTVIAEYAIEKYLREERRIIYTGPIKALSNQKFRDFSDTWGDQIGIITGDVNLNPFAPVLIMTTEIFRNTIFENPARLDDVEYVILDEIHFINDIQRGTVWEESLLFAPQHIGFICLSATVPNMTEFSSWVASVREGLAVTVVEEDERPVPLEHHIWLPGIGEATLKDLRRVSDRALKLKRRLRTHEVRGILGAGKRDPSGTGDIISYLDHMDRLPALYFCFSRLACENNASRHRNRDLLDENEREQILGLFDTFVTQFELTGDAGAKRIRELLSHGVCFHHAGILPILKEIIERIFATGLLKLLFTTETFAVGVNMPAATVVFESLEKYDGVDTRYLLTREYQQMAGRAGRRGIDEIGYVYARLDPTLLDIAQVSRILTGDVEPTTSQFNLSYSSVLSLYAQFGEEIYTVCERSFSNYQNLDRIRQIEAELAAHDAAELPTIDCFKHTPASIARHLALRDDLVRAKNRATGERQRLQARHRGRPSRKQLQRALAGHNSQIERLEARLAESECEGCRNFRECFARQTEINRHEARRRELTAEINRLRSHQRRQISRRLELLRELGYIDGDRLTAKGDMAAGLSGFELAITELFFAGFFEDVTEDELACLMVSIVFESKRSGWYRPLPPGPMRQYLRESAALLRDVARRETEMGIEGGSEPIDDNLSTAVLAWLDGANLERLQDFTDTADGDIVRNLRHAVDLLRQFRRVVVGHDLLHAKLDRTIANLRRGPVDAERQLRLGHHLDTITREARLAADHAPAASDLG